jgi:GGDEF domain-containing protein
MQTAGGAFLLIYLVSLLFGVFHLATQQMLRVATFILLLYGLVIWLHWLQGPESTDLRVELLQWAVLAFVVVWFSIMVGYIHTLMARVDQAEFDDLTGAYTRRRIFEILRHEKLRADRGAGPLSVCLLDLDNLKRVNDILGHQAGDLQLKMVVRAVQRELRKGALDRREHRLVTLDPELGVMTALQQQLIAAKTDSFRNFFPVGWHIGNVSLRVTRNAVEIAKLTISNADIGCVYISIYLPGNFSMWYLFLSQFISHEH